MKNLQLTNTAFLSLLVFLGGTSFSAPKPPSQSLTMVLSQKPSTLDPRFASDAAGMRINHLLFESLVRLDENLKIKPSLASSWSYKNLTYTFEIPKNQSFSNGRKIKAEDIEFSFNEYRKKKNPFYGAFKKIKQVTVSGNDSHFILKVFLESFSAVFLSSELPILKILPKKKALSELQEGVFSGPFQLDLESENRLVLKANPYFKNPPKITTVIFKIIRDDLTRFQAILKGEIDIIQSEMPYSKIEYLKKRPLPYRWFQKPALSMNYLLINMKDSFFKEKKARQILNLGINKEEIIKYKLKSMAEPAASILLPESPFFNKGLKPMPYQFLKAKKMVEENKWTGQSITIKTSNNDEVLSYAKVMAAQLTKLGFKVRLDSSEWGAFYKNLNQGRFQLALLRWVGAFDPDIYRVAFHSSQAPPMGRNRGFYINQKLDRLLSQGAGEPHFEKRKAVYLRVQEIINEDLPIIPLWHHQQISLVKKNIKGYFLPIDGSYSFLPLIEKK